jgi:hypothetical protein
MVASIRGIGLIEPQGLMSWGQYTAEGRVWSWCGRAGWVAREVSLETSAWGSGADPQKVENIFFVNQVDFNVCSVDVRRTLTERNSASS